MPLSDTEPSILNRRRLLQVAGLGTAASLTSTARALPPSQQMSAANGDYSKVALKHDNVLVAAIQTNARPIATADPRTGLRVNLAQMCEAIDRAQSQNGPKDLISFHDRALQGAGRWDRAELDNVAIEIPGPECAVLAQKAREYDCYISFGALALDPAWPGHVLSLMILIDPDGQLVAKDWRPTQSGAASYITTTESVLDRFLEMYGVDAVLPVHRTIIGNIALAASHNDPEIYRAMALKGAEIFVRGARDGAAGWDLQATSAYNRAFTIVTAAAESPPGFTHAGGSAIYGTNGEILAEASVKWEQTVTASLPLAYVREHRQVPTIATSLVLPIYAAHHALRAKDLS